MEGRAIKPTPEQLVKSLKACATTNQPNCCQCYLYQQRLVLDGQMSTGEWCDRYLMLAAMDMLAKQAAEI